MYALLGVKSVEPCLILNVHGRLSSTVRLELQDREVVHTMASHHVGPEAKVKSPQPETEIVTQEPNSDHIPETLRYHLRAFWFFCFYIPLVTLPWIMTVFLSRGPFARDSYIKHQGFSGSEIDLVENWVTVINVLFSIANLATLLV